MIQETLTRTAINYEYQPDGGSTPVLDAYDGCQLCCPYCFQWNDPTWNRNIQVKTNFPQVLTQELAIWDSSQTLYVGSRSDPYMMLEGKYHLTRAILQVLLSYGIPCNLSTKTNSPAFFEDIGLFRQFGGKIILCIGQTNLAHLRENNDVHAFPNIRIANELIRFGIQTWVFITPVLPGITDVKKMIDALPVDTPIFLDKLRMDSSSGFSQRFFRFLKAYAPSLETRYQSLIQTGSDPYYQELQELYRHDRRVKFVFGEC